MRTSLTKVLILALVSIAVFSCTKDDDEMYNLPEKFPLKTGNNWEYERTINFYFKNDSTAVGVSTAYTDTETHVYLKFQEVEKDTILEDTISVFKVVMTENDIKKQDAYAFRSIYYLQNKDDGLYRYNSKYYKSAKTDGSLKKYRFKGIDFDNLDELKEILGIRETEISDIQKYSDYNTYIEIEYPIELGIEWNWGPSIFPAKKEITGVERIILPSGIFEAYKIRTFWDWNEDGVWDDDYIHIEYVSKKGIVKIEDELWNAAYVDENAVNLGYFDAFEEEVLTDYDIK